MSASLLTVAAVTLSFVMNASTPETDQAYPPPPSPRDDVSYGQRIQRSMELLATSTAKRHQPVRVLFYGQSITRQQWSEQVADWLRDRYANADLTIENRAIGGFAAPKLKHTLHYDVLPFFPDLIIFHVYGPHDDYEQVIRTIRSRTTAEILLVNDHVAARDHDDAKRNWHDRHSHDWLPKIAARYNCGFADIRTPWKQYLKDNDLEPQDLLRDDAHLNDHGNYLMAELVKRHLAYNPTLDPGTPRAAVANVPIGEFNAWQDGVFVTEFDGVRAELIASPMVGTGGAPVQVQVDGKPPGEHPSLYSVTRPRLHHEREIRPPLLRVESETLPVVEAWTLRVDEVNYDEQWFSFAIEGSATGEDGLGRSDQRFVSVSGRVVIEPEYWWMPIGLDSLGQAPVEPGSVITWSVQPQFIEMYTTPEMPDPHGYYYTTLVQGLPPGRHTIELIALDPQDIPPIGALRVYTPPVTADEAEPAN